MSLPRVGYLVLLFVISWSAYYLFDKQQSYDIQVEPNTELPMFSGKGLTNTSYTDNGLRSYVITSASLDHYAKSGDTHFQSPVLKVYREGSILEWELSADTGVLNKDHILVLSANVNVKNLLPESGFSIMSTDSISIQLENRDFWTDGQVVLVGPQFETVGGAMVGNFADHHATLQEHVQGRYETLTP
jgi:lipopolysaccharide export system protein LptC